jgi:hypothetical protein
MFSSTALEVGLSLVLIYIVLSIIVRGATDLLATMFNWRGATLRAYVGGFLGEDLAQAVYAHPLIFSVTGERTQSRRFAALPGYPPKIPPNLFALVLLNIVIPSALRSADAPTTDNVREVEEEIHRIPDPQVRETLLALFHGAALNLRQFTYTVAEIWGYGFSQVEDRFQSRLRGVQWMCATLIVVMLNIDTVQIARTLWEQGSQEEGGVAFPLHGWTLADVPVSVEAWLAKLTGLFLTVGALTFGAEFWLGILERLSGVPERKKRERREDGRREED